MFCGRFFLFLGDLFLGCLFWNVRFDFFFLDHILHFRWNEGIFGIFRYYLVKKIDS